MSTAPSSIESTSSSPESSGREPWAIVTGEIVSTGGMDRANLALASYLARTGHRVHTVTHTIDRNLAENRNVVHHPVARPLNYDLLGMPLISRAGMKIGREVARAGGRVLVNGGNCPFADVNWVHYVHAAYTPESALGVVRNLKTRWSHRSFLKSERRCLQLARVVIANSEITRKHLIELVGVKPERVHTVYYGIDADAFAPASEAQRLDAKQELKWTPDRPVVIFIGALGDRRKGFDTLFAAWKRLCEQPSWDADLAVVGRGAELPVWEQRARDAGIASRIHFLGFRKDVPRIIRAADALVSPTRYEAFGLGVQEALACGLPALVTADAGVAERYPAEFRELLLPDANDVADLARRLQGWRESVEEYRRRLVPISDAIRSHSWDKMAQELVQCAESNS